MPAHEKCRYAGHGQLCPLKYVSPRRSVAMSPSVFRRSARKDVVFSRCSVNIWRTGRPRLPRFPSPLRASPPLSSVDACEILPFFSPYCKPEGLSQKRKVVATEMTTTQGSYG
ncbi:hypothetical protein DESPIG_01597 [Desulfovibrio piger ATCC 29098]|uniref:Uncharacterized protein n=1 Tax=Desulfovibrio piger ATCC 29098 TaxID=411464 RepID=B6WU38_9BACT|nr:hypothetical protein DESPIG_01597 [Desulfovibrio piger ATCC 29098]